MQSELKWVKHGLHVENKKYVQNFCSEIIRERDHLRDLVMVLKWILDIKCDNVDGTHLVQDRK